MNPGQQSPGVLAYSPWPAQVDRQRKRACGGATQYELPQQPTSVQSKPAPPVSPSPRQAGWQNSDVLPGGLAQVPEQQPGPVLLHSRLSATHACGVTHRPWEQAKPAQQPWVALHDCPSSRHTGAAAHRPPWQVRLLQQPWVEPHAWPWAWQLPVRAQVPLVQDKPGQQLALEPQLRPVP